MSAFVRSVLIFVLCCLPSLTLGKLEFKRFFPQQQVRASDGETTSFIEVQAPTSLPRGEIGEEVNFHHLDSTFITGITERIVQHPSLESITLHGSIIGGGIFSVICSIVESNEISCAGNIRPATNMQIQYELRYDKWLGLHKISPVNVNSYEDYARESVESVFYSLDSENSETIRVTDTSGEAEDTNQIVDVMVIYTKTSIDEAGSEMIMQALVNLAIDESNQILRNSDIDLRLRLVHCMHTIDPNFVETDGSLLMRQMLNISDGYLDEEMTVIRMEVGADMVHIVESAMTTGGLSSCLGRNYINCASASVVRTMNGMLHELGHTMGLHHNLASSRPGFGYSYGHCWDSETLNCDDCGRSIMAYPSCVTQLGCDRCRRTLHLSNPNVLESGSPTGVNGSANNAKSLNQTKDYFSNIAKSKEDGGLIFSATYNDASGEGTILGWRIGNGSDIESVTLMNYETDIVAQSRDNVIVSVNGSIGDVLIWNVVVNSSSIGVTIWNISGVLDPQNLSSSSSPPATFASWFNDQNILIKIFVVFGFIAVGLYVIMILFWCSEICFGDCDCVYTFCCRFNIFSYKKTRSNFPAEDVNAGEQNDL